MVFALLGSHVVERGMFPWFAIDAVHLYNAALFSLFSRSTSSPLVANSHVDVILLIGNWHG